jgi:hypothetical protein
MDVWKNLKTFLHVLTASRQRRHSVVPCTTAADVRTRFTGGLKSAGWTTVSLAPGIPQLTAL